LGIDSNNLPMDAKTRVEIEALGNQVMLYFNGTFAGSVVTPSPRLSGEAYLFASDLWYPPANAVISNYELKEIDQSRLTVPSAEWSTEVKLTSRNFGKVTLPENFELSFDITPLGLVQGWASIIHFSKDGQDANRGSRIPG
jgi:hypothetical protein